MPQNLDFADFRKVFNAMAAMMSAERHRGIHRRYIEGRQLKRALSRRGFLEDQPFILTGMPARLFDFAVHKFLQWLLQDAPQGCGKMFNLRPRGRFRNTDERVLGQFGISGAQDERPNDLFL